MKPSRILVAICMDKSLIEGTPLIITKDENELQKISTELARIFEGDVYRLSNGVIIITSSSTGSI
ncbi:MAG: capping complex subunit for YIEGIA [Acetivibrionales bacterium]|jgi:SepF-like predicted cell division protein (DUF552 family)